MFRYQSGNNTLGTSNLWFEFLKQQDIGRKIFRPLVCVEILTSIKDHMNEITNPSSCVDMLYSLYNMPFGECIRRQCLLCICSFNLNIVLLNFRRH